MGFIQKKKKYLMRITVTPKWNVCTLRCADSRVRVPLFPGLASTVIQCVSWVFSPSLYQNVNSRNFYIKIHNSLFVPTWRIHTAPRHFTQIQQLLQQDFTEQRYSFVLSPPFLKTADSIMEHLSFSPLVLGTIQKPLKSPFCFSCALLFRG